MRSSQKRTETLACKLNSPLGPLLAAATPRGVCWLSFADCSSLSQQAARLARRLGCPVRSGVNRHIRQLRKELGQYFAGRLRKFRVRLDYQGTAFQKAVWRQLRAVPYGQTISYRELADRLGRPGAMRAVGRANAQNCIGILIPCHRVIRHDGQLGGYAAGLWRKRLLLRLEQAPLRAARCPLADRPGPSRINPTAVGRKD